MTALSQNNIHGLFWIFTNIIVTSAQLTYDDPECIIDSSLPATTPDNYVDCTTDLMQALKKTECCKIDNAKGCCKPGDNWEQFKLIGIILGVVTVSLAIFLIYWFWFRKNNPMVQRAKHAIIGRYHRVQETCSCCGCCRRAVEKRRLEEEMRRRAAEVPAFDLPTDSGDKDVTFDKFWDGPLVKTEH